MLSIFYFQGQPVSAGEFIKNIKKHSRVINKKSKIALVANRGRDYTNIYWKLDDFLEKQKN